MRCFNKSKTQKKKEAHSLQAIGEKLVKLSAELIKDIDLPAEIYNAVKFAKTLKSHVAHRRQMQYIGSLMRKYDTEPIEAAIDHIEKGNYNKARAFKEIEKWRDNLVKGDKPLLEEILKKYPDADRQQLTQLIRSTIKEREKNKPPKASRTLVRYLRKIRSKI